MPITESDAYAIGVETYTYAYPLVLMEYTRRVRTNALEPDRATRRTPVNRFAHALRYANASSRDVVRPNADTLYSSLWYDVGAEPLVFTLPDTGDRYHVVPFMDMFTDVFATLGTRTSGNGGGVFALVGPRWQGELPEGMERISSPTDVGYVVGRIQTNGPADYPFVHQLQAGLTAVPLSGWSKADYTPAPGRFDPTLDMSPPPFQVEKLSPADFFATFAELLQRNPPHAADVGMVLRMRRLGLVPGRSFDLAQAAPVVQRALKRAAADAYQRLRVRRLGLVRNGWSVPAAMIGTYGNDYAMRAAVAYAGLGALPPEEASYPFSAADGDGQPYTGEVRYVLHFDKDELPPADAFWSLTLYGADQFFVDNPIHRYAIGDRDALAYNADGSLDLHIQHASPGAERESNWLPAPANGPFTMNLRLYLPRAEALDGRWTPPPVHRQN
jgi:hypothetical protein